MSGRRLTSFAAASVSLLLLFGPPVGAQAPLRTAFVHLFEWRWDDIATECEQFLGPKGFAAVQVSPPNEHRLAPGRPWWERYQPVSYKLDSRSGDRATFENMVKRCAAVGVKVYADAVINHMTGTRFENDNLWGAGSAGSSYDYKQYPNYGPQDFHQPSCDIVDYGDRHQVQNCNLVALADLNTGADYVRDTLAGFLNDLQSVGVAGFRIDAAKHMASGDIAAILSRVNGSPEVYQEVIESPGEPIQGPEYFGNGLVTEFDFGKKLAEFFRNGNLRQLRTIGGNWQELMPSDRALVFVDNHDNQRGHGGGGGVLTHEDDALYDLANVFMLAWPYGYPRIMSSYAFSDDAQGPPNHNGNTTPVHGNGGIGCGNAWLCEHRRPAIANMVEFRNVTLPSWTVDNWWDNGGNRIAFGRGNLGFVAINRSDQPMSEQLQTSLAPGSYCDVISGALNGNSCTGTTVDVHPGGAALFRVPAMTAVAIHVGQRTPPPQLTRTVIMIRGETVPGQDMFLRGGLDHRHASSLGRNCTDQNLECAVPIRHRNIRNATTAGWKAGDHHLDWYGTESMQPAAALGTPMDWTTNQWPTEWGDPRSVSTDGFGLEPLNTYGPHYWMLDVDMDCAKTGNGWFEVKSFISNGPGWESDVSQPGAPWPSGNHFARCGYLNVFDRGNAQPVEQRPLQP
jgi:alpha-amylase